MVKLMVNVVEVVVSSDYRVYRIEIHREESNLIKQLIHWDKIESKKDLCSDLDYFRDYVDNWFDINKKYSKRDFDKVVYFLPYLSDITLDI